MSEEILRKRSGCLRNGRWFAANECDIVNTWNMLVRKRKGNGYVRSCTCDKTIP